MYTFLNSNARMYVCVIHIYIYYDDEKNLCHLSNPKDSKLRLPLLRIRRIRNIPFSAAEQQSPKSYGPSSEIYASTQSIYYSIYRSIDARPNGFFPEEEEKTTHHFFLLRESKEK